MQSKSVSCLNPKKAANIQDAIKGAIQKNDKGLWFVGDGFADTFTPQKHFTIPFKVDTGMLRDFTDSTVQQKLEVQDPILNWDRQFVRLFPLKTAADNNCLCHGVSYSLTGAQDRRCLSPSSFSVLPAVRHWLLLLADS